MSEAFFDNYEGQTTQELLALEGRFRIDSLVLAFEEAIQRKPAHLISTEESYILSVEARRLPTLPVTQSRPWG